MKRVYVIEFGGEKEVDEMNALELNNIDSAILWIHDSMQSDEEYFNIDINYQLYLSKYEQYDSETNEDRLNEFVEYAVKYATKDLFKNIKAHIIDEIEADEGENVILRRR